MIPIIEINRFANIFNVSTETIEKDYIISWILHCLSKSTFKDDFTFYGGTAIKRMYFEDHRFSEDIDLLSSKKYSLDQIINNLACLDYARNEANLVLEINKNNIISNNNRIQIYINYLGYDEILGAPKEIRLDFAMDMEKNGKVLEQEMIKSYSDLKQSKTVLSTMSLNTILANKLGLLFDQIRNEPRDLYDIWFLFQKMDIFDYNFNQVREAFKGKFGYHPTLTNLKSHLKKLSYEANWKIRLNKQVANLPDFKTILKDTIQGLEKMFSLDQTSSR